MKHFTKITLATAMILLSSSSLTWAQQQAKPKSVMDMLAAPPKIDGVKSGPAIQAVIKKPVVKAPEAAPPVAPIVTPPIVAQPVIAPPISATPPAIRPPEVMPPNNMPVVTALPEPVPPVPIVSSESVTPMELPPTTVAEAEMPIDDEVQPTQEKSTIPAEVKASLENDFKDKLKFPMTEQKMIAFIRAGKKIEDINSRWDVEIAAAETDKVAMENNNFAVEDIKASLSNLKGLTLEEYNDLSLLTTVNENFANLVATYREFLKQGVKIEDPVKAANAERMDAVESQIKVLKSEIEARRAAMTNPAPASAADPLASAQIDALTAKLQQMADRLVTINQRAVEIEKKVKPN